MNKFSLKVIAFFLLISSFSNSSKAAFVITKNNANISAVAEQNTILGALMQNETIGNAQPNLGKPYGTNTKISSNRGSDEEVEKMAIWAVIAIVGLILGGIGLILSLLISSLWGTAAPYIFAFLFVFGCGYLTGEKMGMYLGKKGEIKTRNIDIKSN